ncbi:hypothetical protein M7I_0800 [Glarea lozoyensis 74030]|uniref:Uncharacterized protein n=1 Tax=Glarea lozoyensis (strain ATCC 74030 / MF5533) TaxID=1104152 RepID=H0EEC5_GLAL7|nr:hypothetical protein M7I_0800 [Glarea lozoyensis 74030]
MSRVLLPSKYKVISHRSNLVGQGGIKSLLSSMIRLREITKALFREWVWVLDKATTHKRRFSPPQQAQPEAFDEAAFARAFDEAAQLETASGGTVAEATVAEATVTEDSLAKETSESELERLQRSHHKMFVEPNDKRLAESRLRQAEYARQISPPIGADAIRPQNQGEPTQQEQQEAPDDLARTAGSLLRSVQHDTSDKFQGSQFLTLMRMLRDKEVAVQGDDIVGTGSADVEGDAERAVGDAHGARPSDFLDMWDAAPLHA